MNKTKCSEENDCQYFALPQFRAARLMANQKHTNFDYKTQGGDAALKSHNFSLTTCSLNVIIGKTQHHNCQIGLCLSFPLLYFFVVKNVETNNNSVVCSAHIVVLLELLLPYEPRWLVCWSVRHNFLIGLEDTIS